MKRIIKLSIFGGLLFEFLKLVAIHSLTVWFGGLFIIWVIFELLLSGYVTMRLGYLNYKKERAIIKAEQEREVKFILGGNDEIL